MYRYRETPGKDGAPLLFTFHGTGGDADQFHGLAQQLMPEAHVISPHGDVNEGGAARFFRRTSEGVYDMADLAQRQAAMRVFVSDAIARLTPPQVLAFGYSNGANILAAVMLDGPAMFDRVALLHPLIPWKVDSNPALSGCDVLITAGQRDPICPPQQTQALAAALSGMAASVDVRWHAGGHEIAQDEVTALAAFLTSTG